MAKNNNTQLADLIREFADCQDRKAAKKKFDDNREYLLKKFNTMSKGKLMRMYEHSITVDRSRTLAGFYWVMFFMLNVRNFYGGHLCAGKKFDDLNEFYWVYVRIDLGQTDMDLYTNIESEAYK